MQHGREAADLGSPGMGAGWPPSTGHRVPLARGWGGGRVWAAAGARGVDLSQQSPPSQGSRHCVPHPPRPIRRGLLTVLHLKGLLGTVERARMMPELTDILIMRREGFLRIGLGPLTVEGRDGKDLF